MRTPDEQFRAALRADPAASAARLAKQLGVSGRARRRIERELEAEGVLRTRRRWWIAGGLVVVGGLAAGSWAVLGGGESTGASPASERRVLSPEAAALERDLYRAIDRRDPARTAEALFQLRAEEEPLRLAALRYLVSVGATERADELVALVDDPSERVRTVAIQLLGSVSGAAIEERLAKVLADGSRPLGERTIAAASLEARRCDRPQQVARLVLPALLDDSQPLRAATVRVLAALSGLRVEASVADRTALHAAWRAAVGATE
ncbi:MAG: hypothetical protein M9894_35490 [Planctomycetes bacterium]|nr:hypothetical protein [Planctomycetota bacterium]